MDIALAIGVVALVITGLVVLGWIVLRGYPPLVADLEAEEWSASKEWDTPPLSLVGSKTEVVTQTDTTGWVPISEAATKVLNLPDAKERKVVDL